MTTTTSNVITAGAFNQFVDKTAIQSYQDKRFFAQFAKTKQKPKGTHTYQFPLTDKLNGSATTLTEWVTPSDKGMNWTGKTVTLGQYGDFVTLSDVLMEDNPFDLVKESIFELSHLVARTVDIAAQDVIDAGTNVEYVGQADRASLTAANTLTAAELANGVRALRTKDAPTFDWEFYVTVIHPDVYHDLVIEAGTGAFIDVAKYQNHHKIMKGEIGALFGTRIIVSSNVQKYVDGGAGTVDVYPTFMFGKDAYGEVQAWSMQTKYKALWSGGSEDPLDQRATVASKVRTGFTILKDDGLFRIETAASKGDN